jgi:adenylate cyclase
MHRQAHADFVRSHEILEHLVDRHPRAAAPHVWLAQWHVLTVTKGWGMVTAPEGDRALGHTRRAIDLNPDSAMSLAMEAFVHCHMKQDLMKAHERVLDALAINPNEPWAWLVRSIVDSLLGRGEDAWQWALRARWLSPMDPVKHYFDSLAASAAVAAGRYAEAETLARMALSKDSRHLPTLRALAIAQVHRGALDQARDTVATVMRLQPLFTLERYVGDAPPGSEVMRSRWATALRAAGAP